MATAQAAKKAKQEQDKAASKNGFQSMMMEHPMSSIFQPLVDKQEALWENGRNMNALSEVSAAMMQHSMALFNETAGFVTRRMTADAEAVRGLTSCKTAEDYFTLGSGFVDGVLREYAEESAKLLNMTADAVQEVSRPIEDRTKEALHSIALIPKESGHFV